MRWLVALVLVMAPAVVLAKPKVAVAPIDGDKGGKVADAVVDITNADSGPDKVSSALETMGSENVNNKVAKKLRTKLKADVVVHGKVAKSGKSKHLTLWLAGKSKTGTVELDFKTANSKSFRRELREEIEKQMDSVTKGGDDEPVATEDKPKHKKKKKMHKDDPPPDDKVATEDKPKHKKKKKDEVATTEEPPGEEGEVKVKKKHKDEEPEAPFERTWLSEPDLTLVAGFTALHHSLNYVSNGMDGRPPPAVTTAPALDITAEYYPKQLLKKNGNGWGFAMSAHQVVGLKIAVPNSMGVTAPITEATYTVGAKYRLSLGKLSAAAGLEWWRQRFIAQRSGIPDGLPLDLVDSDYTAVAPTLEARYPVTPKVAAFVSVGLPYAFAGATTFGNTSGLGFDFVGGADYQVGKHYAVRFDLAVNKLTAKYKDQDPTTSQAAGRGIAALSDQTIGFAATFALLY